MGQQQHDMLSYGFHIVNGLVPQADAFATSATTDYINLKNYRGVSFLIHTGDATSGTADGTVTILAASDAAGTGAGAVAFRYRTCASSTTVDTWSASTAATSAGFSMTAGDNYMYLCTVLAEEVEGADAGNPFVALKVLEVTNDPIVASIVAIPFGARYSQDVPLTAIS